MFRKFFMAALAISVVILLFASAPATTSPFAFTVTSLGQDSDLCHGVDIHTDEILGRYITVGLDVDTDLLQDQLILLLQKKDKGQGLSLFAAVSSRSSSS